MVDENTVQDMLSADDLELITEAASMPLYILESISQMIETYCTEIPAAIRKRLHDSITDLYKPYTDTERISSNPMGYSYVAHIRLLLVMYLVSLPLALVETMGFVTIPVYVSITYALMSVEMLAVEVENPFGYQTSDLRLFEYNVLMKDAVLESWRYWLRDVAALQGEQSRLRGYDGFGREVEEEEITWDSFYYW